QVLFDINLEIQPGEFVILTGPSGSGKSTLLSLMGCLRSVQNGSLQVLGQELKGASAHCLAQVRRNFGYIFQASNLLTFLTVEQNIATSLELQDPYEPATRRHRTAEILDNVSLLPQLKSYPWQLSGGQRQRAAIAGALVTQPKLVLADEPTAALDSQTGRQTVELMHRLAKQQGSAVLMVTHDPRILDLADRILHMEDGKLDLAYSQELSLALPGLKEEKIATMAIKPETKIYEPGEIIFLEGDIADRFYVVLQGQVQVFRDRPGDRQQVLATLERGKYFGEIGLLKPNNQRSASVRVPPDAPAKLMTINREDFLQLMNGSDLTEMAIAQTLQQRINAAIIAEALPTLDIQPIVSVLPQVQRLVYGPGSYIIQTGETPDYFYIIAAGVVEIFIANRHEETTASKILSPGDYFGEIGMLNEQPRTATVRAHPTTTVEVLAMDQTVFNQLLATCHVTQTEVARVVYERLQTTSRCL
ncbi:MAG: cyclic nucleotide-binding domain-containing protein, partial [Merismopedia sp. SIO2A8]|nr:cyclic nucleotide-binding domain-containing protein [Merismopedia sp. SIO2A8]